MAPSLEQADAERRLSGGALSLALLQARNHNLLWLSLFQKHGRLNGIPAQGLAPVLWMARLALLHAALMAQNGQPEGVNFRPEGLDVGWGTADPRWNLFVAPDCGDRSAKHVPQTGESLRTWLQDTFDPLLELLEHLNAGPNDNKTLTAYRMLLLRESRVAEMMAVAAQEWGLNPADVGLMLAPPPSRRSAPPLWLPAQRFSLGSKQAAAYVPRAERWAHEESVPEFEIDAQAVSWDQFVAFAEDDGYNREPLWGPASWAWLQAQEQRGPRHVVQLRGGAIASRFGVMQRLPGAQAAAHLSWHEADAWCRWAGRRLPTELEWEVAACSAGSRGFVWADVWEWAAGSARLWPGAEFCGPLGASDGQSYRVLRGSSCWTRPPVRHPKQRRFAPAEESALMTGFRSCAL